MTSTMPSPQEETLLSEAGEVSTTPPQARYPSSLYLVQQGLRGRESLVAPSLLDNLDPLSDVHNWGSKRGPGDPNALIWLSETPGNAGVDTSQGTQEGSAASMKNLHLNAGLLGTA